MYTVYWRYKPLRFVMLICIIPSYLFNTKMVGMSWVDWVLLLLLSLIAGEIIIRYIIGKFNVND